MRADVARTHGGVLEQLDEDLGTLGALSARHLVLVVTIALLGGCRKSTVEGRPDAGAGDHAKPSSEWSDFQGVQYRAPPGTQIRREDSVLPGPGGQGGRSPGVRPSITLVSAEPRAFYLEIIKTLEPLTLDGMTFSLRESHVGMNHEGKTTPGGWELTYDSLLGGGGAPAKKTRILYADLAGGHYHCIYSEESCTDPAAAEAICRSIRARPAE